MSDFVQTTRDWRRLCRTMWAEYPNDMCDHCPLLHISPDERGCDAIYTDEFADNVDWSKLEQIVKKWAAEHPEPKYPTWVEWLMKCGVLMPTMDTDIVFSEDGKHLVTGVRFTLKAYEPMPADTAQKLGVRPC